MDEVIVRGSPSGKLADSETDMELNINARFHLTSGLECQVIDSESPALHRGIEVWTEDTLVRRDHHGDH